MTVSRLLGIIIISELKYLFEKYVYQPQCRRENSSKFNGKIMRSLLNNTRNKNRRISKKWIYPTFLNPSHPFKFLLLPPHEISLLQCFCLCRKPNPFCCIMHHQIEKLIINCSPIYQSVWKHKVYIKVFGTQVLQDMVASQQTGILSPLFLRDLQILLILGSF